MLMYMEGEFQAERTARAEAEVGAECQACTERASQRPLTEEEELGEMMHRRNRKQVTQVPGGIKSTLIFTYTDNF